MEFVPPLTDEEAEYWEDVLKHFSEEELKKIKELPEETPKLFVLGVMRTFPKAKGVKLVRIIVKAVQKHIAWREENDLVNFLRKKYPKIRTYRDQIWPLRICGHDKEGFAVVLARLSEADWAAANKVMTEKHELITYFTLNMELQKVYLRAIKRPYRTNLVFDFKGLSWSDYLHAWRMGLSGLLSTLADHNPESVKTITIVNAPSFFSMCFKAIRPLLPQDTIAKIQILSSGRKAIMNVFEQKGFTEFQDFPHVDGRYLITDNLIEFEEGSEDFPEDFIAHISDLLVEESEN